MCPFSDVLVLLETPVALYSLSEYYSLGTNFLMHGHSSSSSDGMQFALMELIAGIMVQQSVIQNLKAATSVFV
jgi:hypothetical protein